MLQAEELETLLLAALQLPSCTLPDRFRAGLLLSRDEEEEEKAAAAAAEVNLRHVRAPMVAQGVSPCLSEAFKQGVPAYPLYKHLAYALCEWFASSVFPRSLEPVPGLYVDDNLGERVQLWANKIREPLTTLQDLLRCVKLHLHVQEPFFTQLRERLDGAISGIIQESSISFTAAPVSMAHERLRQRDLILLNRVLLVEVQVEVDESETVHETLLCDEVGRGMLGERSLCDEEMRDGTPLIQMHCLPVMKQPLKIVGSILEVLGVEGVKALLGLQSTVGSLSDALPPKRSLLLASFMEANKGLDVAGAKLSVGARALAKHVHRSTCGWWGPFSGNDEKKNELARNVIAYLVQEACWMNVHHVPPHSAVFEIRVKEGFGARWVADGTKFRGFLEPHMPDGHAKRWRH